MAYKFEQTGTVSVTNGSLTVTGTGTAWLTDYPAVALNINGLSYPVAQITGQTSLTLLKPYPSATASGIAYSFLPLQPENYALARDVNYLLQNGGVQVGKSAYDLAVENGFVGTEHQWLDSLAGDAADTVNDRIAAATADATAIAQAAAAVAQTASSVIGTYPASAAVTVPSGLANGSYYWATAADAKSIHLFQNVGGTATAANPPVSISTKAVVDEAVATIGTALQPGASVANLTETVDRLFSSKSERDKLAAIGSGARAIHAASSTHPTSGDLGELVFSVLDEAGYLGAGLTKDGTLASANVRALGSMLTPLLNVAANGAVKMGTRSSVQFVGDGSIQGSATALELKKTNYDISVCDEGGNVAFGWLEGKFHTPKAVTSFGSASLTTTYFNGVQIEISEKNYDFCICDANDNVLLGWLGGKFYSPTIQSGYSYLDTQDAANKAYSASVYQRRVTGVQKPVAAYNALIPYGQSLGQGDETWPALSTATRLGNLMLGGNTLSSADSATFVQFTPTGLQPLAAQTVKGTLRYNAAAEAALAAGDGARGEPSNIGWANGAKARLNDYLVLQNATDRNLVTVNVSKSGATIGELEKNHSEGNTELYNKYLGAMSQMATAITTSTGVVSGLCFMQGEHDYLQATGHNSVNRSYDTYKPKLTNLAATMQADAMAQFSAFGQSKPPAFLIYQTGASYTRDADMNGMPGMHIGMAQLDFALTNDAAWIVGPVYPYTDKGGHLDSNGSRWFGHQIAKVWHHIVVEGRDWQPLRPIDIWQDGGDVYLSYHVPVAPLVFDEPQLSGGTEYSNASRGFRLTDATGNISVTAATIVRDTIVKLTCSRTPGANAKVWYASQGTSGNGMVRDSDTAVASDKYEYVPERGMYPTANITEFVNKPYPLHNWSVGFCLPIDHKE